MKCTICGRELPIVVETWGPDRYHARCGDTKTRKRSVLTDTILREGVESQVMAYSKCVHLGERTGRRVKAQCSLSTAWLPEYRCAIHRLTSPFGACSDPELVKTCQRCTDFKPI